MEERMKSPGVNGPLMCFCLTTTMRTKYTHNHTDFYTVTYDDFNINFSGFIKYFFPQHAFNQYIFIPVFFLLSLK